MSKVENKQFYSLREELFQIELELAIMKNTKNYDKKEELNKRYNEIKKEMSDIIFQEKRKKVK